MNQQPSMYQLLCKPYLYLIILCAFRACSQPSPAIGAHQFAIANSGICSKDAWNTLQNPGVLLKNKQLTLGTSYTCPFLLKDLQKQALVSTFGNSRGQWSIGSSFQKNTAISNAQTSLGYAINLNEQLSAGIQLGGTFLNYGDNYGRTITPQIGIGFVSKINENWYFGGSVHYQKSQKGKRSSSSIIQTGFRYSPATYINCHGTFEKSPYLKGRVKIGVEYQISEVFQICGGFASSPSNGAFGFNWKKQQWQIDTSVNYQTIIGWTPSIGFHYQLRRDE